MGWNPFDPLDLIDEDDEFIEDLTENFSDATGMDVGLLAPMLVGLPPEVLVGSAFAILGTQDAFNFDVLGFRPPSIGAAEAGPFEDGELTQAELTEYYTFYNNKYGSSKNRRKHLHWSLANNGDTDDVGKAAAAWYSVSNRLYSLADDLTAGLLTLRDSWTGEGSTEFMKHGFTVVAQVLTLADQAAAMQQGVSMMSSVLGIALEQLKDGAPNDTLEQLFLNQAYGYSMYHPTDWWGRVVKTVAELALHYNLIEHKYWYAPRPERSPEPPPVEPEPEAASPSTTLTAASFGSWSPSSSASSLNQPAATMQGAVAVVSPDFNRLPGLNPVTGDGSPTSMGMMPGMMGMAGAAGAGNDPSRNSSRPLSADEIAWSKDDHAEWVDGDGDKPPPTIGRTA